MVTQADGRQAVPPLRSQQLAWIEALGRGVVGVCDGLLVFFAMQLDLRRFDISTDPDRMADVTFSAKLLSASGHVLAMRLFEGREPSSASDDLASVKALNVAFRAAVGDLSTWVALQPDQNAKASSDP